MDDFLHSEEDDNVSDVDPEELQKMLEGLDFSDDEKSSKVAKTDPKVPKKSSNLKSSIKVVRFRLKEICTSENLP